MDASEFAEDAERRGIMADAETRGCGINCGMGCFRLPREEGVECIARCVVDAGTCGQDKLCGCDTGASDKDSVGECIKWVEKGVAELGGTI